MSFKIVIVIAIDYVKDVFPNAKKVIYLSDGCGAQYKNCKIVLFFAILKLTLV